MHINVHAQVRARLQAVTEENDKVATMLEEQTALVKELQGTSSYMYMCVCLFIVVLKFWTLPYWIC